MSPVHNHLGCKLDPRCEEKEQAALEALVPYMPQNYDEIVEVCASILSTQDICDTGDGVIRAHELHARVSVLARVSMQFTHKLLYMSFTAAAAAKKAVAAKMSACNTVNWVTRQERLRNRSMVHAGAWLRQ